MTRSPAHQKHVGAMSGAMVLAASIQALLGLAPAWAGPIASAEVRVNTATAGAQEAAAIAMDADGDYVVTWQGNDASSLGVFSQRYSAAGSPRGPETLVNTTTDDAQYQPSVAMDSDGSYVIAWNSNAQDGSLGGVYAQRYNAAGIAQGIETRVNTTTASNQSDPSVAMDASGDYVIAWTSNVQDGSSFGIYAQRFDAGGTAQGVETRVNTTTANAQTAPSVAMDADGDYVVAWESSSQDGSGSGVYAQRYAATGSPRGSETRANTTTADDQVRPSAAMDADGNYVIAWSSNAQDGSGDGVYAQRYAAGGATRGSETRINTTTTASQERPSVAMDARGGYIVTWQGFGQDLSGYAVYAQRFSAAGAAQGSETRANTTTANDQLDPSVAIDADGDYVVAWTSNLQDGSGEGIYARRFRGPEAVDLALTQSDAVDVVAVGGRVTYRVTVANLNEPSGDTGVPVLDASIGAASGVFVVSTIPDGAAFGSAAGAGWTCTPSATTVRCRLATTLAAGEVAPGLLLTYTAPDAAGPALHTARVYENQLDPAASNSGETERTNVWCSIRFTNASYSVAEAGSMTVSVTRDGTGCGDSTVQYESASGAATEDTDFTAVGDTLVWGEADDVLTFAVPIIADALDEKNEQLRLRLSNPSGALLGTRSLVNGTITDNDLPPRINFVSASGTGAEPGALVEVSVRLSEASGQLVTVTLARSGVATAGSDYFAPTKVTVPAGVRTVQFALEVADDGIAEGAETAILTLTTPIAVTIGSLKTYTLTITSNE